jgi:glycosyltransferase involved in cell wall biosynthesis
MTLTRVLMTADAVGGVWQYALALGSGLVRSGVRVTLAVMGPPPASQREAATRLGMQVRVSYGRLEWMADPWRDVDAAGRWLRELEARCAPDVVHLNGYCHANAGFRAPVLVAAHSCVCSWWRAVHAAPAPAGWNEYRARVSRGLSAAGVVIAPSAAMLDALRREYAAAMEHARVIPNGATLAAPGSGGSRRGRASVAKEPCILAAGRLWDEAKNIQALCAAAPRLAWPVYVAGDACSPDGARARTSGVRPLGRLEPSVLQSWLARASIYALPAKYEPFGLSVLEAALCGCALVLGDIPSLRENWSGAAVFVPPDDARALAAALARLISDPHERDRLGATARTRAAAFTPERMVAAYLDTYQELLAASEHRTNGPCASAASRTASREPRAAIST